MRALPPRCCDSIALQCNTRCTNSSHSNGSDSSGTYTHVYKPATGLHTLDNILQAMNHWARMALRRWCCSHCGRCSQASSSFSITGPSTGRAGRGGLLPLYWLPMTQRRRHWRQRLWRRSRNGEGCCSSSSSSSCSSCSSSSNGSTGQQQRLAAQQVPRSPWSSPAGVPPPPLTPKPPPSPAAASNYASSPPPRAAVAAFNGTASPIASVASVSSGSPGSSAGGSGTKKKKRFSWSAIDGGKAGPLLKPKTFEEEMAAALASPAPPYSPQRVPPPPTSPKPAGMRSPAAAAGGGASSQPPLEAALAQMYDQLAATDAEFSRLLQATKPPRQSPWGAQPSSVSPQRGSSSEAED